MRPRGPSGAPSSNLPSNSSFSSRLVSLLSLRSCFSISALIRLDSFASSLRQQAITESKAINMSWKGFARTFNRINKAEMQQVAPASFCRLTFCVGVKLLSTIKYITGYSKDWLIVSKDRLLIKTKMHHTWKHPINLPTTQNSRQFWFR